MSEKRCYSIGEIQDILGICKTTAYHLIKENRFRSVMIGGKYKISKRSFDAWLDGEAGMEKAERRSCEG
jgi:excisionase family DNA binding protein